MPGLLWGMSLLGTAVYKHPGNSVVQRLHPGTSARALEIALLTAPMHPHSVPELSVQLEQRGAFWALRLSRPSYFPHPFTGRTLHRILASLATTGTQQRLETCSSFPVVLRLYKELGTEDPTGKTSSDPV